MDKEKKEGNIFRLEDKHFHLGPSLDKKKLVIPTDTLAIWQGVVNSMTVLFNVPSALITRVDAPHIEVLCSIPSPENPYIVGDRKTLPGIYSEAVIKSKTAMSGIRKFKTRFCTIQLLQVFLLLKIMSQC